MEQIKQVLKTKHNLRSNNVNVNKKILNNVNVKDPIEQLVKEAENQADKALFIAKQISEKLSDSASNSRFHLKMANKYINNPYPLFECLSETLQAQREGIIKTTAPRYYVWRLKMKELL